MAGVKIIETGIDMKMRDHVHIIIHIPPKFRESDVAATLRARSASLMRKKFQWLKKVYWKENVVWLPGFFLSTTGVDEKVVKNYVRWQGKQDLGQTQLNLFR